jgi:Protein of unknown function (DUF1499)
VLRWVVFSVAGLMIAGMLVTMAPGREAVFDRLFPVGPLERIDFATLRLHERPNQYLVCPKGLCAAAAHRESPAIALPVEKLEAKWRALLTRKAGAVQFAHDKERRQFDVVLRTSMLRFPDVVTIRFIALDAERSTVAVYSRSLYGRSDFGVNRARVDGWLAELAAGGEAALIERRGGHGPPGG